MEKGGDRALQGGFCFTRDGKPLEKTACSAGGPALTPGLGRAPGEGNGNSLQYSCLENSMDAGAWAILGMGYSQSMGQKESNMNEQLSPHKMGF